MLQATNTSCLGNCRDRGVIDMNISDKNDFAKAGPKSTGRRQKEIIRSKTVMQAIGNWLFRGSQVYVLDQPDRTLKTKRINWNRETTDVEDETGTVFNDIPWERLEFRHPEDYHLAGDD